MLDETALMHQHAQLIFHRILYILVIVAVVIKYCANPNEVSWVLFMTFGVILGLAVIEGVLTKLIFFNREWILQFFTYLQYLGCAILISFLYTQDVHLTMLSATLMLCFMFEYSYYCNIGDDFRNVRSILILVCPALLSLILSFCINGVSIDGFLMLLGYAVLYVADILLVRIFYRNERTLMRANDKLILQVDTMKDNNDQLVEFKSRMQKVNDELNLQKIRLGQMNKEINQANAELAVQAELLKNINGSLSKDIPSFIKYIINSIMETRKAEFCGIYIDKDVYYNKKPFVSFVCASNPELKEVPEMVRLYEQASDKEEEWEIMKSFPEEEFPSIAKTNSQSGMVMPLVLDGKKYGVLFVTSEKRLTFENRITFYEVIVPQFSLAIHNFQMYEKMRHIAQTDGLTGINNRTHFNRLFAEQMEKTVKNSEPLSVALFDIDKFKRINDTYGHLVGDEVIKTIASLAYEHIETPELGFICRYGGEEFVIVLPNTATQDALPIIEDLHKKIAATKVECYGYTVSMTVSIGLTSYPNLCDDASQLLKRADWSMYYAKEHGRNQVKVDGPDVTEVK